MQLNVILLIIILILLVFAYFGYRKIKTYNKIIKYYKNAIKALGVDFYIYNNPSELPITLFNSELPAFEEQKQLLHKGENFCIIEKNTNKIIKGLINKGQAYIISLSLDKQNSLQYEILNYLPCIAWLIDEYNNIIFVNKLYQKNNCNFTKKDIEKLIIELPINGKIHILRLSKQQLQKNIILIYALDITEQYELEQKLTNNTLGYRESFNFLPIAISIFDKNQKLIFANQCFIKLFNVEEDFINNLPNHSSLFEELRTKNKLPLFTNWQEWRDDIFKIYSNFECQQYKWNLPDGTVLRVIAQPQPQGGVCWIYENLTPMLEIQMRYNNLIAHQSDTLDNLLEGVVLFGSNGKILLSNPAFTKLWGLDVEFGVAGTHINILTKQFKILAKNQEFLEKLPGYIAGVCDMRNLNKGQIELKDERILEYSLCPMRLGQTIFLFSDVTAKLMVQKALAEKNEALLLTDKLRNEFVRNVSYDLITPLTSIDGFTQLLTNSENLSLKTKEYLTYISTEAKKLNNMIQDMIDLASLNAGITQLELQGINLEELLQIALKNTESILRANNINCNLNYDIPKNMVFYGDRKRIVQLLINVLSYCALHAIHNHPIELNINYTKNIVCFTFITAGLVRDTDNSIELPLAQSICKLWGGTLQFIKSNDSEQILCNLPLLCKE